jgi:putative glycosyltransferase (TIGR04372 family)
MLGGRFAQRGETLLSNLGLTPDDWFVCLHARESSSMGDIVAEYRNQEISHCFPTIEHITGLGGHVIRMGDSSMKHLPSMRNVIDYAHSRHHSSFADIFLCSRARFFIGCTSGLRFIPAMLETPILDINIYPLSPIDISKKSITIFKRVYSDKEERYLTLQEILDDKDLCFRFSDAEYKDAGLAVVENTSMEILCAAQEMLGFLSMDPEFTMWTPQQRQFLARTREVLHRSHKRGLGDAASQFYPDAICRIGSAYCQENWELQTGSQVLSLPSARDSGGPVVPYSGQQC